jgi:hypothetical protein
MNQVNIKIFINYLEKHYSIIEQSIETHLKLLSNFDEKKKFEKTQNRRINKIKNITCYAISSLLLGSLFVNDSISDLLIWSNTKRKDYKNSKFLFSKDEKKNLTTFNKKYNYIDFLSLLNNNNNNRISLQIDKKELFHIQILIWIENLLTGKYKKNYYY